MKFDGTHITAAPVPLRMDGKEYTARPLQDIQIEALNQWVRAEYIRNVRRSFTPDMKQEDRESEMRVAQHTSAGLVWMSGLGAQLMRSPYGFGRVVYEMIHADHPTVTHDEVVRLMHKVENLEEATDAFNRLNTVNVSSGKEGPPRRKNAPGRGTKNAFLGSRRRKSTKR